MEYVILYRISDHYYLANYGKIIEISSKFKLQLNSFFPKAV